MPKKIKINNFLSAELHPEFTNVSEIEIEDDAFAEGGFGKIYKCLTLNGKTPQLPQVIKIFTEDPNNHPEHNYKTTQELITTLKKENQKLSELITEKYVALKAVPQFCFEGELEGKTIKGYSATNLSELGFIEFENILSDPTLRNKYFKLSLKDKMLVAFYFIEAFKFLRQIPFVHADLKAESLFINLQNKECALIDFDSGIIIKSPTDTPNTLGAPHGWIAPEVRNKMNTPAASSLNAQDWLNAELWGIMLGVFYILTTFSPFFFFKQETPKAVKKYLSKYLWPDANPNEGYFNPDNTAYYEKVFKKWIFNSLPRPILELFQGTIQKGYFNPKERIDINKWFDVFSGTLFTPVIKKFVAEKEFTLQGLPVTIEWETENAKEVRINTGTRIHVLPPKGKQQFFIEKQEIELIAVGSTLKQARKTLLIRLFPVPLMKSLEVPMPEFKQFLKVEINSPKFDTKLPSFQYTPINTTPLYQRLESLQYSGKILFDNALHDARKLEGKESFLSEKLNCFYKKLKQYKLLKISKVYEKIKSYVKSSAAEAKDK